MDIPGSIKFINDGVSCFCLVFLQEIGVLDKLLEGPKSISELSAGEVPDSHIESALLTLKKSKVVRVVKNKYKLTELGIGLQKLIGLVMIFFKGYGELAIHQKEIHNGSVDTPETKIRSEDIAKSATLIASKNIESLLIKKINHDSLDGTICDLGCGMATTLQRICAETGRKGLGIEISQDVVDSANEHSTQHYEVKCGDILRLNEVYPNVTTIYQCHVFHDFITDQNKLSSIDIFFEAFPNLHTFYYIDTVSPSKNRHAIFPGFDLVHGILNIPTPTYEDTVKFLKTPNFRIEDEHKIPHLPNTYIWTLKAIR